MRLVILDDYDLVSEWAAKYVRNRINKFNPGPDRHFVLGLPTGEQAISSECMLILVLIKQVVCFLEARTYI